MKSKAKLSILNIHIKNNFIGDYKRKLTEVISLPGMIKCVNQGRCSLL